MTERYSTFTLKIKALANLGTLSTYNDAEIWDINGRQGMNTAERGSFKLYASDATLLADLEANVGQVVTVYVTDQVASGAKMDLATFIIKSITTETGQGVSEVTVSGPEITDQLRNTNAGNNAIDNGAGGPSTTDIADIMGYAAAGWTLTNETATAAGTYHAARGDTVLKLLNAAAQQSGELFRLATYADPTSKGLFWAASPDSSGVTLRMPSSYNQYDGSTTTGKLYSLRREYDFEPVITRIRPFGAGVGDGRLDITGIDSGDTGADPAWLDTTFVSNLMANSDLETALGYVIEQDVDFSWIQANDPTNGTQLTSAAVAVWKTGKNYLEQNDAAREFYTAVCNVPANLRPGQSVTVVYSEYQGGMTGGSQTININKTLTILAVENRLEEGERITTLTLGDKPLPQPTAAQWVADVAEKTQDTTRKSDVGTSPGAVSISRTLLANLPLRIDGGASADLSADRTLTLDGLSSYGAANQVAGANAAASGWEYKTVTPGAGISVGHSAGAITITNTSPGGADLSGLAFVTIGNTASLSAERALVAGAGLTLSDGGANGNATLAVGAGDGIDVTADSVAVDATDLIGTGLTEEATNNIAVDFTVVAAQDDLHPAMQTGADTADLFSIFSGQFLNFDDQAANTVLAGPTSGADDDPTMRLLVDADIPSSIARDSELHNQVHVLATTSGLGPDHTVSGLTTGQVLRATGASTAAFGSLQHSELGGVSANQHHNQSHVLATTSALGPDHTVSGLTSGQVLRATGATTAAFGTLQHSQLGGVSANQHHNQSHVLATTSGLGADHTVSGLTARQVLIATSATAAQFRALQTADLPTKPSVRYRATSNQSVASGGFTALALGTEIWDTGSHWSGGGPARLTVGTGEAGKWLIIGHTRWEGNSSGERVLGIELNALTFLAMTENNPDGQTGALEQTVSTIWDASDGEYFRLMGLQTSGGNLNAEAAVEYGTSLMMIRLSD